MAEKLTKDVDYYQTYLPPPQLGKWDGFKQFLWNSERGEFLGRTGSSWLKVTVFYIIFYICLAAFFAVMLIIFYQTLDNNKPKWTLDSSLIGANPGLGFRPMPRTESNVDSTLIWFKQGPNPSWKHWSDALDTYLEPYQAEKQTGDKFVACDANTPPPEGKVCTFSIKDFGNCSYGSKYGYDSGKPCVVIKMNRIWGWEPTVYTNDTGISSLPPHVQDVIKAGKDEPTVWVTCEGENPADKENIGGMTYFPQAGLPAYYFPYTNTPGYLSPIVAVRFEKLTPGVLVNIECKAWAKNIVHARMERRGSVHLEMLMD